MAAYCDIASPRLRTVRRFVLVAVLSWAVAVTYLLVSAAHDLERGRAAARRAEDELTPSALRNGRAELALRRSEARFAGGAGALGNPALVPLRFVPVVGRQLRSAEHLAAAAARISAVGATAADRLAPAFDDPPDGGAGRIEAVAQVEAESRAVVAGLRDIDLGPDHGLVGPLADARFDLETKLLDARAQADRAVTTTAALGGLLRGPRRLLLLAANNAEMRAGSGMFLSAGVLAVDGGEFDLDDMRPTEELMLDGDGLDAGGDQAALWGWAKPGRDYRALALTPRFDATAALAAEMWAAGGRPPVDGVVALDVRGLAALLAATGPVEIDGKSIDEHNVEQLLLHDQYEGLTHDRRQSDLQSQRRERLGEIAGAVVDRLQAGDLDLPVLASRLGDATAGRHLLVWSRDAAEQDAWTEAGIGGQVGPDSLLLAVLNRGGNKLDPFLDVDAELTTRRRADGDTDVSVRVRLANGTPPGQPPYVAGPDPGLDDVVEGEYVGLLALTMPAAATEIALDGGALRQVVGRDGASQVVATNVAILRGEDRVQTVTFVLPGRVTDVVVAAGARVPPVEWTSGGERWHDDRPRTVRVRR